jgi:HTH-type transcriptional regulator / antitoxin HigA
MEVPHGGTTDMKDIAPIQSEVAYEEAITEVRRLWGAALNTEDGNRLDFLLVLVDDYENKNHAIEPPAPKDVRRRFLTAALSDEEAERIASSRMDPRHDHLDKLLDQP